MIKNVEADLQKLLGVTIGDLRARLAYVDADINVEEWLEDFGGLNDLVIDEERDILDDYDEDFEDEDLDDDDYEEEDYDDEDDDWDEEDDESIPGQFNLPSDEEEKLAEQIADDIDEGKYRITDIMGLYSLEFIDRVNYLLD